MTRQKFSTKDMTVAEQVREYAVSQGVKAENIKTAEHSIEFDDSGLDPSIADRVRKYAESLEPTK